MAYRLTWTDNNGADYPEDGFKVYRSATPIDPAAPPAPLATLPPDTTQWDDLSPPPDVYYRVSAFKGADEAFSDELHKTDGAAAAPTQNTITITAGTVPADLTGFPVIISLSDMPQSFWDNVQDDGGNIRAYETDGVTRLPLHISYIDTVRKIGRAVVRKTVLSASDTAFRLDTIAQPATIEPNASAFGRNAVWADYEFVLFGPNIEDATGKVSTVGGTSEPRSDWVRTLYHEFAGNPHQGIACDATGRVITIDTNYLRRYSASDLNTLVAENIDPIAASGIAGVNHLGDGCIIGSELFLPLEVYPNSPYDNQHIVVYDADSLLFKRSYDISANAHEVSSICYDGTDLWITDYTNDTQIYRYSLTGTLLETVTLSSAITQINGIEYVNGSFIIASNQVGNPYYSVSTSGAVSGVIYQRPTVGINEGLSYDGLNLWVMDGGGDLEKLVNDPFMADWVRVHYDVLFGQIANRSTTFTAAASVYWLVPSGDLQQGFLSYANGTSNSNRATLAYNNGADRISVWNSSDSWAATSQNPVAGDTFRIAFSQDVTTERKAWLDGSVSLTDAPISARPVGAGTGAEFVINGSETPAVEDGEAMYNFVWLRHEVMPDHWMLAESVNFNNPSAFYAVT